MNSIRAHILCVKIRRFRILRIIVPTPKLTGRAMNEAQCHNYGMEKNVRTTVDIPTELYARLKIEAAERRRSIRQLIVMALQREFTAKHQARRVVAPLIPGRSAPGPQCPTLENPYDLLFT